MLLIHNSNDNSNNKNNNNNNNNNNTRIRKSPAHASRVAIASDKHMSTQRMSISVNVSELQEGVFNHLASTGKQTNNQARKQTNKKTMTTITN